ITRTARVPTRYPPNFCVALRTPPIRVLPQRNYISSMELAMPVAATAPQESSKQWFATGRGQVVDVAQSLGPARSVVLVDSLTTRPPGPRRSLRWPGQTLAERSRKWRKTLDRSLPAD